MQLVKLDRFGLVDVARGTQHQEQRGPVAFELRTLMRGDGAPDRQVVQVELARQVRELVGGRLVKAEPYDFVVVATRGRQLTEVVRRGRRAGRRRRWRSPRASSQYPDWTPARTYGAMPCGRDYRGTRVALGPWCERCAFNGDGSTVCRSRPRSQGTHGGPLRSGRERLHPSCCSIKAPHVDRRADRRRWRRPARRQ
jgi:hypothetical protein